MSDEHKISFVDAQPEIKNASSEELAADRNARLEQQDQKARRLSNKDDGMKTDKHICSARTGVISDKGGPSKYVKSDSSNTVWDSDKTAREASKLNSERQEKEKQIEVDAKAREEIKQNSKVDPTPENASFSRLSDLKGSHYHVPSSGMSIFDDKDFQRLAEKTSGENLSHEIDEKRKIKDESWKNSGKATGTKDATNILFDRLFKQE
jgi:hypothetical protein